MVARSGLFVDPVPGTPPVGTAAIDGRIAVGGLLGVIPQTVSGGQITQSGSNMNFTVAAGVWLLPDASNGAAMFLSPVDQTVVTPAAGPGSGSRIDGVFVKNANYANGDADSRATIFLVAGVASGSPTAPATPTGAYRLANILVPTSASLATSCTVTVQRASYFAPMPLVCITLANLNGVGSQQYGQLAVVVNDGTVSNNGVYFWDPVGVLWRKIPRSVSGFFSGTTDAVGNVTVTHTLGFTPSIIQITGGIGGTIPERRTYASYTGAHTSTTFVVRTYRQDTGAVFASNAIDFNWTIS